MLARPGTSGSLGGPQSFILHPYSCIRAPSARQRISAQQETEQAGDEPGDRQRPGRRGLLLGFGERLLELGGRWLRRRELERHGRLDVVEAARAGLEPLVNRLAVQVACEGEDVAACPGRNQVRGVGARHVEAGPQWELLRL